MSRSYATSAEMAGELGTFPRYEHNRESMLRVIRNHRRVAYGARPGEFEDLTVAPMGIDPELCPSELLTAARDAWDRAKVKAKGILETHRPKYLSQSQIAGIRSRFRIL